MTTAFLVLAPVRSATFAYRELPFDRILDEVVVGPRRRRARSSTRASSPTRHEGLDKVLDLGEWWLLETGCRCRSASTSRAATSATRARASSRPCSRESISAGLENREEAMRYALRFGRGLDAATTDRFVGMYVNELTCDYGDEGRQAVEELLRRAEAIGRLRARPRAVRRLAFAER